MRRLLLGVVALGVAGAASAQTPADPPARPFVVTTGQAVVRSAPDRAYVSITAESRAARPKDAQRVNAEAMTSVQRQLREMGIPAEAIRTVHVDLQPEFDFKDNRRTLRGYVARNTIEVRVDDLARIGEVLDAAVGSGATSLGGIRFDLRNREALEREALRLAVADARARADAVASGAGLSIDRILRIEEQRGFEPPPMPFAAMRAEARDASTPIVPGEIEVRATVTLTAAVRQ
jgi:uncharacterized protein YggE